MKQGSQSDRWSLVEEIFQNAIEYPRDDRDKYLKQACDDDEDLRSEVESLLASDRDGNTLQAWIRTDLRDLEEISLGSGVGQQVGPYRLVRPIDSGGMGTVFLGVRSDDQYFQIVAIKMIRKGLESPALIQRFRAERQILANLSHPNIGTILDGGEIDDGRPYIVMEYVEGQLITEASENRGMTVRQRVELFRSVCSAIHYAHQKLIIHRDIKPSNVLVTSDGTVKLIDFGISKPLAPELIGGDLPETETSQRLMTPDYASPEQILGHELTTASDIYSLGVLLFELLTGSRPYMLKGLSPAATERVVCDHAPCKPSAVPGLAAQTRRELAGDLDTIVQTAMDPDPTRRYLSARHFDEDLGCFLSGKPIAARKATTSYRIRKFVERHRIAVSIGSAAIFLVILAILFDFWQSRRAAGRITQIETLANGTISDIADQVQLSSTSVETQAKLLQRSLQYLDELRQNSRNDPRILLEVAKAYERVGDLEGSPSVPNLGNSKKAVASYQQALRAATEANARLPGEESTRAVIEAQQRLADIETFLGDIAEARNYYGKSLALALTSWREKPNDPARQQMLAANYSGIGDVELANLEPDKALLDFRHASDVFGNDPNGSEDHDRTLARLYLRRARALNELGAQSEMLAANRKAISIAEKLTQKLPSSTQSKRSLFSAYQNMVLALSGRDMLNVGYSRLSQLYARKALAIAEALAVGDPKNMQARADLSLGYTAMGDSFRLDQPAIAAKWYRRSLSLTRELVPHYGPEAQHWLAVRDEGLAEVLVGRKYALERLQFQLEANHIRQQLAEASPHGRIHLMSSYCNLSNAELDVGNEQKAEQFAKLAFSSLDEFKLTSPSLLVLREIGLCYESFGNMQRQLAMRRSLSTSEGKTAEAQAHLWYARSADVWSEWDRRHTATPETERERRKLQRLLSKT